MRTTSAAPARNISIGTQICQVINKNTRHARTTMTSNIIDVFYANLNVQVQGSPNLG